MTETMMVGGGLPVHEAQDPLCLDPAAAAQLLAAAPWGRFVVVGDSLAAGTGDPTPGYRPLGWADRVAGLLAEVRPDLVYRNHARVGATIAQVIDEQLVAAVDFVPDLIHISAGANDLFARRPDFVTIEHELRVLFAGLGETGAQTTTFTLGRAFVVDRYPDWSARVAALNTIIREVAADHGTMVVDMWAHPVNDRPNLVSADGIHFAGVGQAAMASAFVLALTREEVMRRLRSDEHADQ